MTERLYYRESSLAEFEAHVVESVPQPDGRAAVRLDRTAFYPTSGGQPHDTGWLGDARVVDVVDDDGQGILHVLDTPVAPGPVRGRIDWGRRFDHMQQHTGQHLLSAAFDRIAGARTVSFHMGAESATIDLEREVSPQELEAAEAEANRIVWNAMPVTVRFVDAREAAALPLRKESAREGVLRLIEVAGVDLSACGGTHVENTGAVGVIALGATEKIRGGTRAEFVCGIRALRSHRRLHSLVAAGASAMSVAPGDLPSAIERLQGEARDARRHTKDLQGRLAVHEAAALVAGARATGSPAFVVAALDGWDAGGLKQVAMAVSAQPGMAAILLSAPAPAAIVVARAAGMTIDSGAVLKQMVARFGGKGGGRPELAQGGGLDGAIDEMLAFARTLSAGA